MFLAAEAESGREVVVRVVPALTDSGGPSPEGLHHLLAVAPDLGIKTAAACVEHAHHRPVASGKSQRLAQAPARKAPRHRPAGEVSGW